MVRFKFLPTLLKTPPVALLVIAFRGSKEKSDEYENT